MRGRLGRTDLLLLSVVLIWAASFSVVKYALREIGPLAFSSVRFVTASVMLLIWAWVTEGKPVIRREDWLRAIMVGLTAVGVYQVFFAVGLQYTTASNSSLMLATIPAWTAMFAAASGQERIAPLQIVGMCMSFVGVALTIRGGGAGFQLAWDSIRGDAMTLIAAALSGASAVLSRRLLARYSALRMMSVSMLCGSVFLVVVSVPEMVAQQWSHISWGTWLALAFSAVPAAGVAYVIWFKSIGEIGASRTVIYNNLIPPVAILIALTTLGERLTALQALGAAIVLGGVVLTRFAQVKGLEPEPLVQVAKSDGSG
ncbi:MAG TPA: EamA family transporter [Anaerolineae bacterium]|nr:EamA family transporter [Anaerolineae bacterium]HUW94362.1 EamA family transporter [Anaerolineae bacterium]